MAARIRDSSTSPLGTYRAEVTWTRLETKPVTRTRAKGINDILQDNNTHELTAFEEEEEEDMKSTEYQQPTLSMQNGRSSECNTVKPGN